MPQNDTNLLPPKKNAKTHLFGQKRQEVPCFFKEVRFEKRAPLVISREFVNPFAKTGGKASILARPSTSRLSSLFAAYFLGTDAQKTGNAVLTGRLLSQTGSRDMAREKTEPAEQVVGTVDFTNRRQTQRALFACSANTLVIRKTVVKRYKRTCKEKNEKRYLFERNGPKVPCFCEEVPFSKGSPSTISRELKVPLRKNWGKNIDFQCGRPAEPVIKGSPSADGRFGSQRGSLAPVAALTAWFLCTAAQTTGNAVWMGQSISQTGDNWQPAQLAPVSASVCGSAGREVTPSSAGRRSQAPRCEGRPGRGTDWRTWRVCLDPSDF